MNKSLPLYRCIVSVAPLRKEASDRAEIVSQLLFGERIQMLDESEKWAIVESLDDQYQGWVDKKQIAPFSKPEPSVLLTAPLSILTHRTIGPVWLPGGAQVTSSEFEDFSEQTLTAYQLNSVDIERCAMQYLNAPYLWGGKTILGIDCSGFTQTVYRICGLQIARDAYQQAEHGRMLDFIEESETGDLAFFDNAEGKIVHVGIVIHKNGERTIIHASGKVRIDQLDHQGIFNTEVGAYSHNLRFIRRLI